MSGAGLTGQTTLATGGFHTYAVEWGPTQLQWFVDGVPYWTVTESTVGSSTWKSTFGHGYFVLLNLAIGDQTTDQILPHATRQRTSDTRHQRSVRMGASTLSA